MEGGALGAPGNGARPRLRVPRGRALISPYPQEICEKCFAGERICNRSGLTEIVQGGPEVPLQKELPATPPGLLVPTNYKKGYFRFVLVKAPMKGVHGNAPHQSHFTNGWSFSLRPSRCPQEVRAAWQHPCLSPAANPVRAFQDSAVFSPTLIFASCICYFNYRL